MKCFRTAAKANIAKGGGFDKGLAARGGWRSGPKPSHRQHAKDKATNVGPKSNALYAGKALGKLNKGPVTQIDNGRYGQGDPAQQRQDERFGVQHDVGPKHRRNSPACPHHGNFGGAIDKPVGQSRYRSA